MTTPAPTKKPDVHWSLRALAFILALGIIGGIAHDDISRHWRNYQLRRGAYSGPSYEQALRAAQASPRRSDREAAATAIGAAQGDLSPFEIEIVCRLLADPDTDMSDRALRALFARNEDNLRLRSAFIDYGRQGGDAVRPALAGLGVTGVEGRDAVMLCIAGLDHPDARTRSAAIALLTEMPADDPAVARLLADQLRHPAAYVRQQLSIILVRFAPLLTLHAEALVRQASREDWFIRRHLLDVLLGIGPGAAPAVLAGWRQSEGEVRNDFARTLATYGPGARAVVPELLAEMAKPATTARDALAVAEIVSAIDAKALAAVLDDHLAAAGVERQIFALDAFAYIPEQARTRKSRLLRYFQHDDPRLRLAALRCLVIVDDENAPAHLAALRRDPDPDIQAYIAALAAAGR